MPSRTYESKIDDAELIRLYNEKETLESISKVFGVTRQRIAQKVKDLGLKGVRELKHEAQEARVDIDELKKLYTCDGLTKLKIAEHFKVYIKLIDKLISTHNIKRKTLVNAIPTEELSNLYIDKGMSAKQISAIYGLSHRAVEFIVEKSGLRKHTNTVITPELLKDLYINKKMTQAEIAKHLGVVPLTIFNHFKKYGIKSQRKNKHQLVVDLHLSGATKDEIAKASGYSKHRVYVILKDNIPKE